MYSGFKYSEFTWQGHFAPTPRINPTLIPVGLCGYSERSRKMEEHEMWWNLRRVVYRNTLTYAETEIIRSWLQGFPKVIRVLKSKTWDPESQGVVDAFERWYDTWWESGVFKQG